MPERRLHNKLENTSAVTDLVTATKIQPVSVPQGTALPYIVYQNISRIPENHSTGTLTSGYAVSTIQVDCFASTYSGVKAVADVVRAALSGWSDTTGDPDVSMCHLMSESDIPQELSPGQDVRVHGVSFDFRLDHNAD